MPNKKETPIIKQCNCSKVYPTQLEFNQMVILNSDSLYKKYEELLQKKLRYDIKEEELKFSTLIDTLNPEEKKREIAKEEF